MIQCLKWFLWLILIIIMTSHNGYTLVGPVRTLPSGNVLLVPNDEIKLTEEHIDLYHHPLGIWLVEYRALLKNLRFQEIIQTVGFPSGFDVRMIEGDLYCDRFENFKVVVDDQKIDEINFLTRCSNYVETTGAQWSVDDGSGIGFLNTWKLKFEPDEATWITITFSFIVKKAPPIYNPDINESWYVDLINWVHQDYSMRDENYLQLPVNIGSFWAFYPDSFTIRTYIADDWFKVIDKNKRNYKKEFIKNFEYSEPVGFYSPPAVTLDTLTIGKIKMMSRTQLVLLKNSFLAKYGKKFNTDLLNRYFTAQPWYRENPEYNNWYLTQWDIDNIKLINTFLKEVDNGR